MKLFKWLGIVALIYVALGLALFLLQERIIFQSKKLAADYKFNFSVPFTEVNVHVNDRKNLNLVKFTVPDSIRKGIVLYFHGNRGNITRYARFAPMFTKNGYETWMMDYPGYGKSTGKRSERQLYEDAGLVYNMAIREMPANQIIIYGKSLGTGIAAQLASVRQCKRVILESPYYSLATLASRFFPVYPVKSFIKYQVPTFKFLQSIHAPVSILHGTRDGLIPYKHARWLSEEKPGIELIAIGNGRHNNLAEFELFKLKIDSLLKDR